MSNNLKPLVKWSGGKSDEIKNLDPETLYFITNLLNQAKIKKVRNQILNLSLPLRV